MNPAIGKQDAIAPSTLERDRLVLFRANGFTGESRWIRGASGRTTYAVVRGDSACPTILVHGGIADASVWHRVAGLLPGAVVIPDRPGHGLSFAIDYRGVDYRRAAADWLLEFVDGLGVAQADIAGNSMGGFFAMAFALAYPARVRRLVLVGAPAGLDRQIPLGLRLWATPLLGGLITRMALGNDDPEVMRKRVMAGLCTHPERISVDALRVAIAASSSPSVRTAVRTMLRCALDLGGWRRELDMREPMAASTTPTLFVWGDQDAFAPPSSGQQLAARMPAAHVEIIEDAGHLPQLDQPELVARSITCFLAAG